MSQGTAGSLVAEETDDENEPNGLPRAIPYGDDCDQSGSRGHPLSLGNTLGSRRGRSRTRVCRGAGNPPRRGVGVVGRGLMLGLPLNVPMYLSTEPTDLRKGVEGLS